MTRELLEARQTARIDVCRRCGWRAPVIKVDRRARRAFTQPVLGNRLCVECVTELRPAGSGATGVARPGAGHARRARQRAVA